MLGSPIYGNHQIPCLKVPQDMMEQIAKVAWLRPYYFQGNNLPGRDVSNPKPHNGKLGTMEDNLPGYSLGYSVPRLHTNLHTWYLPGIGGPQKRPKNTVVLLIRTAKKVSLILGNPEISEHRSNADTMLKQETVSVGTAWRANHTSGSWGVPGGPLFLRNSQFYIGRLGYIP